MATLDYALLSDFAQVEGGKLSLIGGSYTHATVGDTSDTWFTSIAGRVKTTLDEPSVELSIRIVAPAYELDFHDVLQIGPDARPYGDGEVGILFASNVALPIIVEGLYEVFISLDGEVVRRLAFDMSVAG